MSSSSGNQTPEPPTAGTPPPMLSSQPSSSYSFTNPNQHSTIPILHSPQEELYDGVWYKPNTWKRSTIYPVITTLLLLAAIAVIIWESYKLYVDRPVVYRNPPGSQCLPTGECLVFSDDFTTDGPINRSMWKQEVTMSGNGNGELQMYVPDQTNSYTSGGILHLNATYTEDYIHNNPSTCTNSYGDLYNNCEMSMYRQYGMCTTDNSNYECVATSTVDQGGNILKPYRSARLSSTQSFKYGRFEIRARLPQGDWLWPAIWMMPATSVYGPWPASGEIDIMESAGNAPGSNSQNIARDHVTSTLHWGPQSGQYDQYMSTHQQFSYNNGTDLSQNFHTYGLKWTEKELYTYVDNDSNRVLHVDFTKSLWSQAGNALRDFSNNPWTTSNAAPFDQEFYLIINMAVGSSGVNSFFPQSAGLPWNATSPTYLNEAWANRTAYLSTWQQNLAIESVKIWQ